MNDELHQRVFNLTANPDVLAKMNTGSRRVYLLGHRDARHAAAELVAAFEPRDQVRISGDGAAAVDHSYYWRDIDSNTPRGVKLQLLGAGGVAIYGSYDGKDAFWKKWAPLPKVRPE